VKIRALIVAVAVAGLTAWVGQAAPRIAVDSDLYEFGSVLEGAFVVHRFTIMNLGDVPLETLRVYSTCGCTTSSLPVSTLGPGATVDVEVVFDTAGYGGMSVTKTVYVVSDDPNTPKLYLHLRGEVRRLQPFNVALTDLQYLLYLLIDLRSPEVYAEQHIIGAVNIPYEAFASSMPLLPTGNLIILYDEDGTRADETAQMLIANGYRDAKSLVGGFSMWVAQMGTSFLWPLGQ
jgi:rhodanese-related sulfurtransferase